MAEVLQIKVGADVSQATKALDTLNSKMAAVKKPAADATNALGNLSRVAQDAPYGFIGIANNINPLLESFQRLRKETGSTGGALKAMASGLTGAGGLGLAIGVVSSLLVVFGDKIFKAGDAVKELKDRLDEYVNTLSDVDRASVKGAQAAQEQLVRLRTLYEATQQANIPLAERKKLVDELQREYPKYFANISDETILAGGAEAAYKKLANAIIQSARARAAQDEIVELQKQALVLERQLTDAMTEEYKAAVKAREARKSIGLVTGGSTFSAPSIDNREFIAHSNLQRAVARTTETYKQLNDIRERAKNLAGDVLKNIVENGAEVLINVKAKPGAAKKIKEDIEEENKLNPPIFRVDVIPYMRPELVGGNVVGRLKNPVLDEMLKKIADAEAATRQRAQGMADTISGVVAPAFQGMFDALLEGQNVVKGFFAGLAQGLKQLLAKMTQALVQALALKAIFSIFDPTGKIAKTSIGNLFKGIMGFANGGVPPVGRASIVGERGPELFVPRTTGTIIPNHELHGFGGGMVQLSISELRLSGKDLVAALALNQASQGRRF